MQFDQFSRAVIEATFSSGFRKTSRKELEDGEIVDYVKQLSAERKQLAEQLDEVSDFEERVGVPVSHGDDGSNGSGSLQWCVAVVMQ